LLGRQPLVIGDLVLAEVLQGFRKDRDFRRARKLLSAFEVLPVLGEEIAIRSAQNCRFLRKRGITVRKTIDAIIATFCIERDLWLLHSDRDFRPFVKHLGLCEVAAASPDQG
jgi:predicted nucleic acid-binding protein